MSEEEAIKIVKELEINEDINHIDYKNREAIGIILNMLERLTKQSIKLNKEAQQYFETIINKDKIIDLMTEEIIIKRSWTLTGKPNEIERLKDIIIREYEGKVEE